MFVVISYDIVDDHRRTRLAKLLCDFGRRVQKSVFECNLDEKRLLEVKNKIERAIDHQVDSVRYYHLCQRCLPAVEFSGLGSPPDDDPDGVIIV